MKRILISTVMLTLISTAVFAKSPPVVSNITISQRTDGSTLVDIRYTLSGAEGDNCTVSVQVSSDGGSTWMVPAVSFTGAVGSNITPGNDKLITWDCIKDLPGVFGSNYRIKVTADNGPARMVWVYINDSGVSGHERFDGYMSKYETTNAQYCQFLNVAKASNLITVYNNSSVYATSDTSHSQLYYNLAGAGLTGYGPTNGGAARIKYDGSLFTVDSGFENHPVTYVSWYGATAFCEYYGYRLPTEWEWQAVADFNGSFIYGCGTSSINNNTMNYFGSTHPYGTTSVGAFGAYGYGMCDMAGNVWEWTSSIYSGSLRVLRSGGWPNPNDGCTVSHKNKLDQDFTFSDIGFRVCR